MPPFPDPPRAEARELNALLLRIGWTPRHLAVQLSINLATPSRWLSLMRPIPPGVLPWLREIADYLEGSLPPGWVGNDDDGGADDPSP